MTSVQRDIMRTRRRIINLENTLIRGRNQRMLTRIQRSAYDRRETDEAFTRTRLDILRKELADVTQRGRMTADKIVELETAQSPTAYIGDKREERSIELTEELRCINEEKREIKSEIALIMEQLSNMEYDRREEGELAYRRARREFLMEEYSRELKRLDRLNRRLFKSSLEREVKTKGEKYV